MSMQGILLRKGLALFGSAAQRLTWAKNGNIVAAPNTGLWADCPRAYPDPMWGYEFFDEFMSLPVDDTTTHPVGYSVDLADAAASILLATGEVGGVVALTTGAVDNNQASMQVGAGAAGTLFEITDTTGKELWFGARIKISDITNTGLAIGLAEENATGADVLADNAMTLADIDFVGFTTLDDASSELDFTHRKNGQAVQIDAAVHTLVADTWVEVGFHFDGNDTLTGYIDGTAISPTIDTGGATFPSGEELSPLIAVKTSSAGTCVLSVDWLKCVQVR